MKRLAYLLLLVVAMAFVSCEKGTAPEMMIPDDARLVGVIDGARLIDKAGIEIKNGEIVFPDSYKSLIERIITNQQLLNDLASSGIKFDSKIYLFSNQDFYFAAYLPISSQHDARQFVASLSDKPMESSGSNYWLKEGGNFFVVNEHYLMLFDKRDYSASDEAILAKAFGLLDNGASSPIANNGKIMGSLDDGDDIALWANADDMKQAAAFFPQYYDVQDAFDALEAYCATLNFEKDKVVITSEMFTANGGIPYAEVVGDASADGLKFIPDNLDFVFSASIDGEELLKIPAISEALGQAQVRGIVTSDEVRSYVAGIDGPVTVGCNLVEAIISYFTNMRDGLPVAYIAIKNDKADEICRKVKQQLDRFGNFIPYTQVGHEYVVSFSETKAVAIGSKDGFLTLRTSIQPVAASMHDNSQLRDMLDEEPAGLFFDMRRGTNANAWITQILPNAGFEGYIRTSQESDTKRSVYLQIESPKGNNSLETLLSIAAQIN